MDLDRFLVMRAVWQGQIDANHLTEAELASMMELLMQAELDLQLQREDCTVFYQEEAPLLH